MNNFIYHGFSNLPMLTNGVTRSVCAENPHGEKGAGGQEASVLGKSRKGRAGIQLQPHEEVTIMDIEGAGVIQHFWFTLEPPAKTGGYFLLRDLVLKMYWDNEDTPSVEVPFGDFFCCGHGVTTNINSWPIVVNPTRGFNCYFAMPFRKHAKIVVENQREEVCTCFMWQITYTLYDAIPDDAAYFHAQWRREKITKLKEDYVILDGVKGQGHYVGTFLQVTALERYWFGEGEIKFYVDGDKEYPTICGTGYEDYFGGGWSWITKDERGENVENLYNTAFLGYPYYSCKVENEDCENYSRESLPMRTNYRWHIMDPIRFKEDLKVTIQQIGTHWATMFERQDDYTSVAYWYQTEPHNPFPQLPVPEQRWPR